MSSKVSSRVRDKLANAPPDSDDPLAALPSLPSPRPRAITPPPSEPNLTSATANSPFFQRLPAELRHLILVFAFGNRAVHMDLELARPLIASADPRERDTNGECTWRWRSSLCHRVPPGGSRGGEDDALWRDGCRWGQGCGEGEEHVARCQVGAMGWLRACRRAYGEGMAVLYGTNTIHMDSFPLMLHLPRLLLGQTLGMITAVEMVWSFEAWPKDVWHMRLTPQRAFTDLVQLLPHALPCLVRLYLSMWGSMLCLGDEPTAEMVDEAEKNLVAPVDEMVRKLLRARLRECTVEFPYSLFEPLDRKSGRSEMLRFWRPVGAKDRCERGYWIKLGALDYGDA